MDPFSAALLSGGISALGSIGGGLLAGKPKETGVQKQKRELIDDLLASLKGQGSFNNLFQMDEAAFQKGFVDPAQARFKNQTAPQIQQQFIASGQQRGTGLDDTLTRAGVDMDQLLNEQYGQFQQGALNRQSSALSSILGGSEGVQPQQGFGEKLQGAAGGFLSSSGFDNSVNRIFDQQNLTRILEDFSKKNKQPASSTTVAGGSIPREGYA